MMPIQVIYSFLTGILIDIAVAAVVAAFFDGDGIVSMFFLTLALLWIAPIAIGIVRLLKAWASSAVFGGAVRASIAKKLDASGAVRFSPYGADAEDVATDVLGDQRATPEAREYVREMVGFLNGYAQASPIRSIFIRRQFSGAIKMVQARLPRDSSGEDWQ